MDGEQLSDLDMLGPEKLLLRWVNYHLAKAGYHQPIKNFGNDIKDSQVIGSNSTDTLKTDNSTYNSAYSIIF